MITLFVGKSSVHCCYFRDRSSHKPYKSYHLELQDPFDPKDFASAIVSRISDHNKIVNKISTMVAFHLDQYGANSLRRPILLAIANSTKLELEGHNSIAYWIQKSIGIRNAAHVILMKSDIKSYFWYSSARIKNQYFKKIILPNNSSEFEDLAVKTGLEKLSLQECVIIRDEELVKGFPTRLHFPIRWLALEEVEDMANLEMLNAIGFARSIPDLSTDVENTDVENTDVENTDVENTDIKNPVSDIIPVIEEIDENATGPPLSPIEAKKFSNPNFKIESIYLQQEFPLFDGFKIGSSKLQTFRFISKYEFEEHESRLRFQKIFEKEKKYFRGVSNITNDMLGSYYSRPWQKSKSLNTLCDEWKLKDIQDIKFLQVNQAHILRLIFEAVDDLPITISNLGASDIYILKKRKWNLKPEYKILFQNIDSAEISKTEMKEKLNKTLKSILSSRIYNQITQIDV